MTRNLRRAGFAIALAVCPFAAGIAPATPLEDAELGKYWSADAARVPYRAIETSGRLDRERLPLIVFLHGDWQDGSNNESQLAGRGNGSYELVEAARRAGIPLLFVAPQTTGAYWPPRRVAEVVADAQRRWPVDPRRVILTGVSDGATGVWDALKAWPACFAAGVPMSGMTETAGLAPIRDVPQWVFHGSDDDDTNVETGYDGAMLGSRAVVRALRAFGGRPIYTEYAHEKHVIWPRAYDEPGLLAWMLSQRLRGEPCDFAALAR